MYPTSFEHIPNFNPTDHNFNIYTTRENLWNLFVLITTHDRFLLESKRIHPTIKAFNKIHQPEA